LHTTAQPARELVTVDPSGQVSLVHTGESPQVMRAKIVALQNDLLSRPGTFTELPLDHQFVDGMYIRRLFIPKGSLIVGKIHKQDCINVVEKGDISVLSETGSKRVQAGFMIVSPAGLQKVGYAHEDTIFTNIFRTAETDITKLENDLAWETYAAMDAQLQIEEVELCH
jgi:hypothetical protein